MGRRKFAQINNRGKEKHQFIQPNKIHAAIQARHLSDLSDLALSPTMKNTAEKNFAGFTPLSAAVMTGSLALVEVLLETPWDLAVNEKCGPYEKTALGLAIANGDHDIAMLLLQREDVDPNIKDKHQRNAFQDALELSWGNCANTADENLAIEIINHRNTDLNQEVADMPAFLTYQFSLPLSVERAYINNPNANLVFTGYGHPQCSALSEIFRTGGELSRLENILGATHRDIGINWYSQGAGTALSEAITADRETAGDFWHHFRSISLVKMVLKHQGLDVNAAHEDKPMVDAVISTAMGWTDFFDKQAKIQFKQCQSEQANNKSIRNAGFDTLKNFITHPILDLDESKEIKILQHLIAHYSCERDDDCADSIDVLIASKMERLLAQDPPVQDPEPNLPCEYDKIVIPLRLPDDFIMGAVPAWYTPPDIHRLAPLSPIEPHFHAFEAFFTGRANIDRAADMFWLE
ncbi:ankyrin repeat domain-containing protein [Acidovorax sp. CCYZU-2555]|uniref:ankyrin repeat domain-containing protein n=1 Tax=Acidovorax sp. CCYZU-2555 TaxID=2835042 RepID=UPI001BCDD2E6|nr:ankyrin repeat domain-containing protein [Acidovorax sp. CCYZU-2555]MBS7777987.1 ankyrin repeat domain-containing protein [Acidovorax sp. CCYZU-2555]